MEFPLVMCPCLARERNLPIKGPKSVLGSILPGRNHAWLNAAPIAWSEFTGDNGDIKFPIRVPILPETHEISIFDIKRCTGGASILDLAYQVQVGQAVTAGYFGGYSAKMQNVGRKESGSMREALMRRVEAAPEDPEVKAFQFYSRRLLRDLEGKGIIRTAVETTNLAININDKNILQAECVRTFPSVTMPAHLLLKREEIETRKVAGASVIAAVHAGGGAFSRRAYIEAPFDLLYGFRGRMEDVELLSPYEMIMQWSMEEIRPPYANSTHGRSELTEEGTKYRAECASTRVMPQYQAGIHYVAIPAADRIILPEHPVLGNLLHRWVWERRPRPYVPVWSYTKIPKSNISPEENARLLTVYMRPWTLNPEDVTETTPLLSTLRLVNGRLAQGGAASSSNKRLRTKQPEEILKSYATTWQRYIDGNVVSESNKKWIMNLLSATAARVTSRG